MPLDPSARTRLIRILGMLGSDADGEVLNAARAAQKILTAAGMTWEQLLAQPPAMKSFADMKREWAQNRPASYPMGGGYSWSEGPNGFRKAHPTDSDYAAAAAFAAAFAEAVRRYRQREEAARAGNAGATAAPDGIEDPAGIRRTVYAPHHSWRATLGILSSGSREQRLAFMPSSTMLDHIDELAKQAGSNENWRPSYSDAALMKDLYQAWALHRTGAA